MMTEVQPKKVTVELSEELFESVKSWAKANKVRAQAAALVKLIELGLECSEEAKLARPKGYNLDDYFEGKTAAYNGPDGALITFSKQEANEIECWDARVSNDSGLIYVVNRGRPIGSNERLSFGRYK